MAPAQLYRYLQAYLRLKDEKAKVNLIAAAVSERAPVALENNGVATCEKKMLA